MKGLYEHDKAYSQHQHNETEVRWRPTAVNVNTYSLVFTSLGYSLHSRNSREWHFSIPDSREWKITHGNEYTNPDTVTHLSTNRARRWLTSLIKANAPTTTPDHQPPELLNMEDIKIASKMYMFYWSYFHSNDSHRQTE